MSIGNASTAYNITVRQGANQGLDITEAPVIDGCIGGWTPQCEYSTGMLLAWTQADTCIEYVRRDFNSSFFKVNEITMTHPYNMTNHTQENVLHSYCGWRVMDCRNPDGTPMDGTPSVGFYRPCVKFAGGMWTMLQPEHFFEIYSKPTYFPHVGVAGSITPLEFYGGFPGDYIVIKETDCTDAHLTVTTNTSLTQTTIFDPNTTRRVPMHTSLTDEPDVRVLDSIGNRSLIFTTTTMDHRADLVICFASKQSEGNSQDDWVPLRHGFKQIALDFWPRRMAAGSMQQIEIYGAEDGDLVSFTQDLDCVDDTGSTVDGSATSTKTIEYPLGYTAENVGPDPAYSLTTTRFAGRAPSTDEYDEDWSSSI
jgi:hypothetical protein